MEFAGNVHIAAGSEAEIPKILSLLREAGVATSGNPDLSVRAYRSFGIDDARELSEKAAARALGARRVFVVIADSITIEAQNALLKTLEEAPNEALFFLLVPNPQTLLPTVRSRSQALDLGAHAHGQAAADAQAFIQAAPAKRLDMLKPLLDKGEDDARDIGAMLAFLAALEAALAREPGRLSPVYRARKFIADRGALSKPLLEQVALLL